MTGSWLILAILLLLTIANESRAQSTEDSAAFDFSLPGARSRGIGGAFVAVADDATSVYSNPAGLTLLFRPEVSIEVRHWRYKSLVVHHGHAFGQATNRGVDTVTGAVDRAFSSDQDGVSFLSFVYPRGRWAAGVFQHQLVRYEMDRVTEGAFFDCRGGFRGEMPRAPFCELSLDDGVDRVFPARQSFELKVRSRGGALAYNWTETLAVGLAVQYFDFEIEGSNRVYATRGAEKYAAANFTDANIELIGTQSGEDHAWGVNAGVMWDFSERWVAGASFRQGPKFHYLAQTTTGPATLGTPGVTFVNIPDTPFKVPDTFAAGIAFRPSNAWRVGVEYDRVQFEQLFEDIRNTSTASNDPEGRLAAERLRVGNANQFRVGGEYSMMVFGDALLSLRGGAWYDPLHEPFFEVDDPSSGLPAPRWALYFPKRDGTFHGSAGVGIATRRHFQFDAAVDLSSTIKTFAVSSIWRF
jgi:long-subunit fatty acid transport protein